MEQPPVTEMSANLLAGNDALTPAVVAPESATAEVTPAACVTCGATPATNGADYTSAAGPSFVYAIGRIEARFPRPDVEKEFAQATGRADTAGLSDRQAANEVLSQPQNRYLARQLCWVMTIEGLETYILAPRDPGDVGLLVDALRPAPSPMDLDCVIGVLGPIVPPEVCNGLKVPIVVFDQLYSFDRDALIRAIPRPEGLSEQDFSPAATELFDRVMQITDNAGATDEHRALNYLAVRYPAIYATAADEFGRNASLSAVEVQPSPLSGTRNLVDVIFSYTNRVTDVTDKFAARVDVTGEFPYLHKRLSPYYDRY